MWNAELYNFDDIKTTDKLKYIQKPIILYKTVLILKCIITHCLSSTSAQTMFASLEAVKGIFRHWPHISPSSHISGQFLANRLGKCSLLFLQPQSSLPHHGLIKKYVIWVFASPSTVIMYGFWIANSRYPVSKTISRSSLCQSDMPSSTDGLLSRVLKRKLIYAR